MFLTLRATQKSYERYKPVDKSENLKKFRMNYFANSFGFRAIRFGMLFALSASLHKRRRVCSSQLQLEERS